MHQLPLFSCRAGGGDQSAAHSHADGSCRGSDRARGGWVRTAYVYEKNTCMVFRYKRRSFTAPPRTTATPPAHGRSAGGHRHGPQPIDPVFVGYSTSEVLDRENTHAAHVLTRTRRNRAPGVATWASLLGALLRFIHDTDTTPYPGGRRRPRRASCSLVPRVEFDVYGSTRADSRKCRETSCGCARAAFALRRGRTVPLDGPEKKNK